MGRYAAQAARSRMPLPAWPHCRVIRQPLTVVSTAWAVTSRKAVRIATPPRDENPLHYVQDDDPLEEGLFRMNAQTREKKPIEIASYHCSADNRHRLMNTARVK
jgi:hypothetical protein